MQHAVSHQVSPVGGFGLVLGRSNGVYFYPGQPIMTMAVRDGDSLTAPYPDTY